MPTNRGTLLAQAARLARVQIEIVRTSPLDGRLPRLVQRFLQFRAEAVGLQKAALVLKFEGVTAVLPQPDGTTYRTQLRGITVVAWKEGQKWRHSGVFAVIPDPEDVIANLHRSADPYQAPGLWENRIIYELLKERIQMVPSAMVPSQRRHTLYTDVVLAAMAGFHWDSIREEPDSGTAWQRRNEAVGKRAEIQLRTAKAVHRRAMALPNPVPADVLPLQVLRDRGDLPPMVAIVQHLVKLGGMSQAQAAEAVGLSRSTVQDYLGRAAQAREDRISTARQRLSRIRYSSSMEKATGASSSGPAQAGQGGETP